MRRKILFLLVFIFVSVYSAASQTTEFTYQGNLNDSGMPATGSFDFAFRLYDSPSGGNQLGSVITMSSVAVTDGNFSVALDFGTVFSGGDRYLEISVRPAGAGAFVLLSPRQGVRSVPYSVRSLSADTASNSLSLGGATASQYVQTGDPRLTDARSPVAGSSNYIQNTTNQQANSNFNISGNASVGGILAIGTSNPQGKLHAEGGSGIGVYGASSGYTGVYGYSPSSGDGVTGFSIGGKGIYGSTNTGWAGFFNGKAHISDRLGIGTTNPTRPLEVAGTVLIYPNTGNSVLAIRNRLNTSVSQTVFYDNTDIYRGYIGYIGSNAGLGGRNDTIEFGSNGKPITFRPSDTEAMRLATDGDVGIGTTNPLFKLHVDGGSGVAVYGISSASYGVYGNSGTGTGVYGRSNGGPGVLAASTSGNGLHGMTTTGRGVFGESGSGIGVYGSSSAGMEQNSFAGYFSGDVFVSNRLKVDNVLGSIDTNHMCWRPNDHLLGVCSSSLRYKTNVQPFHGGLNIIERLRPIVFNWKEDGSPGLGLGAEEVETVEPLLTFRNDKGEIQGVNYDKVSVVLINALKEQQAQIVRLQRAIGMMQKQIKRLRPSGGRHTTRSGKHRRN